jgi:RND superfamily putative drug exporter
MFRRLADFVVRRWWLVILLWIGCVAGVRLVAPRWEAITFDGDFAYLPSQLPSVKGQRWIEEAFPHQQAKSQMAIAIVRSDRPLTQADIRVGYDIARRLKNFQAAVRLSQAIRLATDRDLSAAASETESAGDASPTDEETPSNPLDAACAQAEEALAEAIRLDESLADYWDERVAADPELAVYRPPRLAVAYHNRSLLESLRGQDQAAKESARIAHELDPQVLESDGVLPEFATALPLLDVWTWQERYFGDKLISRDRSAMLVVLQLSNEFMAVDNIEIIALLERELQDVKQSLVPEDAEGLRIAISGSAAIGADFLRAAAASIEQTELCTIILVVLILAIVYRAPLLIAVPLITIFVALSASTGFVALLTQLSDLPGFGWWSLKIFTTTKIFIVVILFGAGTDYCLFLIARYREELARGLPHDRAVAGALTHVGDALTASALTTVFGLSMMFFADFGKFCYSGPVIGFCLAITLLTCVTLTPALMCGLGRKMFWPWPMPEVTVASPDSPPEMVHLRAGAAELQFVSRLWATMARAITLRPGLILVTATALLLPLAAYGFAQRNAVTYDFLRGLPQQSPSRRGTELLRPHFPVGESGPVTVLVFRDNAGFQTREGRDQISQLADRLYVDGVSAVRSSEDPLGEYEPGEKPGIVSARGRRLHFLRAHPRTKAVFVSQVPALKGNVARFELILVHDPFSLEAVRTVDRVEQGVRQMTADPESFWYGARFALAGTTAAIRDLRSVTQSDNTRIQLLVVLAVLIVLLLILRRPVICLFMMLSVLFSYYVTLGITTAVSSWLYGSSYQGLDWKVPLFLFVILVAIGQDYNVYLVTRVFEEQSRLGPFAGLRRAVIRTGGIITSCGLIMAGTFLSMTSGVWAQMLPESWSWISADSVGALKSIVEMGFALAVGVLLDTFVVRPVLLPAFLALICRWRAQSAETPVI